MPPPSVYVSFSHEAGGLLALWIEHRPACSKDQKDPDGWVSGVDQATEYVIERLCELAKVPGARVVRIDDRAAAWWDRIERGRKLRAGKERRARLAGAQVLFPIDSKIEAEGREEGFRRTDLKKRTRKTA